MNEKLNKTGLQLNQTFIPKELIRKNQLKNINTLTLNNVFEKTTGNIYIEIQPPEIKFNGYELDKVVTATVKIINKAPIPQRVHILPPQLNTFSIKVNKKGPIPSGMSEIIQVNFKSSQFKYQYDVIKINTQTQNFVIPVYAYPTIPNLKSVFPKIIDFGQIQLKESTSNYYPIINPVPIDFQFQFLYQKQCNQIMITPLRGIVSASSTINIQIAFTPMIKCTYTSEVYLKIKQFDFEPIQIKIIGNGKQKNINNTNTFKRIKSSKLTPINNKDKEAIEFQEEKNRKTAKQFNKNNAQTINHGLNSTSNIVKKSTIRSNFPKLLNTKKTIALAEEQTKTINPAKILQKQYLSKYSRVQELDKEKEIKFSQYLGDKPMNEDEIQFEKSVTKEIINSRMKALETSCLTRYNPQLSSNVDVEYKIFQQKAVTWDDKKNDELANRRGALQRFMKAGSQVIIKYRLIKRLKKIKEFLAGCNTKAQVRKKVEESYNKALDSKSGNALNVDINFQFSLSCLKPIYFEVQFKESNQSFGSTTFKPEGKTVFDDLTEIKPLQAHNIQNFKFSEAVFPPQFINLSKTIPPVRNSGEEQYSLKSASLPTYQIFTPTSAYSLPLKIPTHHFIYNDHKIRRYKNYNEVDEKDIEYIFTSDRPIEDEFEGWSSGQHEVLKAKFMRNTGCQYYTFSSFNGSANRNDLGFLGRLGQYLPNTIDEVLLEDTIDKGDSDQQQLPSTAVQQSIKLLQKIQSSNQQLKQRRQKKQITNPERQKRKNIEQNLETLKLKATSQHITKIREINKFIEKGHNKFLF